MADNSWNKNELAAIGALARGEDLTWVAKEAGISESTLRRRLRDREFTDDVARARQLMLERVCCELSQVMIGAVATLAELLDGEYSPNTRLHAAKAILEHGCKLRAAVDLERRLEALEHLV